MFPFSSPVASRDAVRVEMRSALFATALPNAVMATIFLWSGAKIALALGGVLAWAALAVGMVCLVAKIALMIVFSRRRRTATMSARDQDRFAQGFAALSIGFASALAMLGSLTFTTGAVLLQMLATGLLFGYASGLVAHTSIRPRLAISCLTISTVPIAVSAGLRGESTYQLLAISLICFMVAAFGSIRQMYRATRQHIITREAMANLAYVDPLTRLPNRLGLRNAFLDRASSGGGIAVHYLDLDAFKPVNDRFGHPTGDALLAAIGDRVRSSLRAEDTAARIGGDEFIILQSGVRDQSEADQFARTLVRRIMAPYQINRHQIEIGVSLGFVTAEAGECSLDELVASADAALYRVKQGGGGVGAADPRAAPVSSPRVPPSPGAA